MKTKKHETTTGLNRKTINPDSDPLGWAKAACGRQAMTPKQTDAMAAVRDSAVVMIVNIIQNCKPCGDRSAAIRKIREGLMLATAAVELEWSEF